MASLLLLANATIVNDGKIAKGSVLVEGTRIKKVFYSDEPPSENQFKNYPKVDLSGYYLLPGLIDDQVHFREPGLTHKADIYSESRAALAGGITSFMEMPNTFPPTITQSLLADKFDRASESSFANYSFFMGATNDNINEVLATDAKYVCGVKIFMGSSTGNMLVENEKALEDLFRKTRLLIATHCEDEQTIQHNLKKYTAQFEENIPIRYHPIIRSAEACYKSTFKAVSLAKKYNTRLHVLHISTAKELDLFTSGCVSEKQITNEACTHHLWFTDKDYDEKQTFIKWNPAVKSQKDKDALLDALNNNLIDVLATDHAPHTLEEKLQPYLKAPSGGPLVQHALVALLELVKSNKISLLNLVEKTAHSPAKCFKIKGRGFIRSGYFADLVVVDMNNSWKVTKENCLYKCKWSPFEGQEFSSKVIQTYVNGTLAYDKGVFSENPAAQPLEFSR